MFAILNGSMRTSSSPIHRQNALPLLNSQNARPLLHHRQPCLHLQILSVKPVVCNNFYSVFGHPGLPRGWPRDSDTCSDYWARSCRRSVTLLPCKSHRHRVCQQLWLRDKYLAQRLSMHHQILSPDILSLCAACLPRPR
jgi:hypothetical protein